MKRTDPVNRWRSLAWAATLVRVIAFVVPLGAGFLAGTGVSRLLGHPQGPFSTAAWWIAVLGASTAAATLTDRLARRLLPLAVLLRMTMVFPDRAPPRLRVARRAGNISQLRRRISNAQQGGDASRAETAELVLALATALGAHDRKTRGHSERTRAYTDLLAEELDLPEANRDRLRWAALLHDVGKLEIPSEVLQKNGPLTDEEWELIREHPVAGMRLIQPLVPWLGDWALTVEHHHEWWDGSGYPHQLSGSSIHAGARIVAVADAYDVITSGRSYKRALPASAARREIVSMAGRQFDPTVARALMNVSLGRLRWAMGPLSVLAQIPFLGGVQRLARDLVTVATSSAVMAVVVVSGAIAVPGAPVQPARIAEQVAARAVASAGLLAPTATPPTTPRPTTTTSAPDTTTTATPDVPSDPPSTIPASTVPSPTSPGTRHTTTTTPTTTTTTTTTTTPATTTTTLPPNRPPTARDDSATTTWNDPVVVKVLANDSDPDGDTLRSEVTTQPAVGTTRVRAGGAIAYSPVVGRSGDFSFTYRACDPSGACAPATVTITVTPTMTAVDDSYTVEGNPHLNVLANDIPGSAAIDTGTLTITSSPGHGRAEVDSHGRIRYMADAGYTGTDTFAYRVCDTGGSCDGATVTLRVTH